MTAQYKLSTIADFLAVPPESIDACLADFKVWLQLARRPDEFSADMNDLLATEGALSFVDDSFIWLDDGLSGVHHVQIVDASNDSEIARISFGDQP
ncbi:hypothetical protein [Paraburkholderia caledonica]|uniref:Uncharacterized protein n=1 Tax=Paraburkholderia caledonica TaxID=134536 RepID=A0AB73IPY8_9BURK|nr:hypothetical protein [Paraburkholderia caledonica]